MNSLTKETKLTLVYILVAFTFSVLMRMIWVYQFEGYEAFKYAGQFMINTNDGYFWAEGARDILSGVHQLNDRSPINQATSQLTAFFVHLLPFSFETIIFYMPSFLSSLIVVPIILIAKDLKNLEMGFIAALLASITWSYYNRTMVGYYDSDMLNIVLPMFFLWSIILSVDTKKDIYILITALDILVYRWWYPQSYALEFSFFGLILLYTLIFDRKSIYNYKLLSIMMFAMLNVTLFISAPLVFLAFYLFKQNKYNKYIYYVFSLSVMLFLIAGGLKPIYGYLNMYIFTNSVSSSGHGLELHYYSVMQTIREAGKIPFETFANRISGSIILFILSMVGYIFLLYKHRIMLFSLPMLGLGFLAWWGGLRFTVYAVPVMSMGIAYLIVESTRLLTNKKNIQIFSYIFFTTLILYPNYKHIDGYKVPTVFNSSEVAILETLHKKADREDYAIAWWDYGFPIKYYANVKTLTDGGKHSGIVNFPVSYILTHPQKQAANMARLDVEYTEKAFREKNKGVKLDTPLEEMMKDYGFKNTNNFLLSLKKDIKLPRKTRDIYFYLPFKMLNIYPTVNLFSNLNLMTGKQGKRPFFYKTNNFKDNGNSIDLGRGISIDKVKGTMRIGNQEIRMRRFVRSFYTKNMKLEKNIQILNKDTGLSVIYMSSYKTFLVLDEKTYNSLYIQLMVLENYDKNLFEKVSSNPYAKLYKLKI